MSIPAEFKDELARALADHLHAAHDHHLCEWEGCIYILKEWTDPEDWDEKDWAQHRAAYGAAEEVIAEFGRARTSLYLEIRRRVITIVLEDGRGS